MEETAKNERSGGTEYRLAKARSEKSLNIVLSR
jgi:hypothetical protein